MILKPTAGEALLFVLFIQACRLNEIIDNKRLKPLKTVKRNSMKVIESNSYSKNGKLNYKRNKNVE